MKLLNKKGFALVETLIVTTFVMTIFIFVYQNLVPLIGEYEKMSNYDDIDSVYAANLYKNIILKYGNLNYIDSYLEQNTYLDISDCSNQNVYLNSDYCSKIKKALSISDDDYIFITKYDISSFRQEVKNNDFFDSRKLSNFRSYISTIGDVDSFYNSNDNNTIDGRYRLFMTRTVTNSDLSTSLKYTNIGIFLGKFKKYNAGDKIVFNPGDGEREFYVLKTSPTTDTKVTLILADNLEGTTIFNSTSANDIPSNVLTLLKNKTDSWNNAELLTSLNNYTLTSGYTIDYSSYRARLLDENDIYTLLGCVDDHSCFDVGSLFPIILDQNFEWLYSKLSSNNGYWLANSVLNSGDRAWIIKQGKLTTEIISNSTTIGVRPVIVVSKDKLNVGE